MANRWIEIFDGDNHGGEGWEYGTCLWSPIKDRGNAKRYELMQEPQKGEIVLHFTMQKLEGSKPSRCYSGHSYVKKKCTIVNEEPPDPGRYGGHG
jgi:hypothetical protein